MSQFRHGHGSPVHLVDHIFINPHSNLDFFIGPHISSLINSGEVPSHIVEEFHLELSSVSPFSASKRCDFYPSSIFAEVVQKVHLLFCFII